MKVQAYIHSLKDFATDRNALGEAEIVKCIGDNLYLAKYNSSAYSDSQYFVFNHVIHHLDLMRYLLGEIDSIDAQRIEKADGMTGYHIRFRSVSGCMGFYSRHLSNVKPTLWNGSRSPGWMLCDGR